MKLLDDLNENHSGWLDWEPETIRKIIIDEDNAYNSEIAFNKIMALQTVLNSQSDDEGLFFTDWQMFEKIVLALNGVIPNFADIEEAEPHEIHYVYNLFDNVDFNEEVKKYIAASYKANNVVYCPFYEGVNDYLKHHQLNKKVKDRYNPDDDIEDVAELEDTPVNVQLKKLAYIGYNRKEI